VWPDGSVHWIEGRGRVVRDDSGAVVGMVGVAIDIDARKQLEAALQEAETRRHESEIGRQLDQQRQSIQVLHEVLIRPDFPPLETIELSAIYLPADDVAGVGGDWYDAFLVPDGRLVLAVGDITGHGVAAARLMAKLRHATRAYACQAASPERMLDELDRFVTHFAVEEQYATMQVVLVDQVTGRGRIASAGHPPALVVSPHGPRFLDLEGGHLLGLGPVGPVVAHDLMIEPGSGLLLYTDGLVERRSEHLAVGFERLCAAAGRAGVGSGAAALRDRVLEECVGGRKRDDDVCLLVAIRADEA
jgi:serine phosphatase RsbU (regulator of sigma subunit)